VRRVYGRGRLGACRWASPDASVTLSPLRPLAVSFVRRVYGRWALGRLPSGYLPRI
jgi:hypothetical protein